jgi:hypothetical protein
MFHATTTTIYRIPPIPAGARVTSEWTANQEDGGITVERHFAIGCIEGYAIVGSQDLTGRVVEAHVMQDACGGRDLDLAAVKEKEECWPRIRAWLEELLSGAWLPTGWNREVEPPMSETEEVRQLTERARKIGYDVTDDPTWRYTLRRLDRTTTDPSTHSNANVADLREMVEIMEKLPRWRRKADGLCVHATTSPGEDWEMIRKSWWDIEWELKLFLRRVLSVFRRSDDAE